MDSTTIAYAAFGVALLTFVYQFISSSPKDDKQRINNLEKGHAETVRDLAALIKTVDRLGLLVDRYIEFRMDQNGRPTNR